jgi:hypothetical protein
LVFLTTIESQSCHCTDLVMITASVPNASTWNQAAQHLQMP